jgi:hypothetical protein
VRPQHRLRVAPRQTPRRCTPPRAAARQHLSPQTWKRKASCLRPPLNFSLSNSCRRSTPSPWVRPASDWLRHRCGLCSVPVTRHRRRTRVCGDWLWHCHARHYQGGHRRYRRASRGIAAGMVNDSSSDKFCPWNRHRWRVLLHLSRRANRPSGICSRFQQFNGDECGNARSGMRCVSMPSRRETNYSCALTVLKTQPRHFNGKETMSSPDLHYATLLVRDRVGRHGCVHRRSSFHGALSDNLGGKRGSRKQRPQLGSGPRQARHYRPYRAVQNRGDLLIRQLLKLAQQDYFAKIQR